MVDVVKAKRFAPIVLRCALAFVFLWFGANQVFDAPSFVGYVPQWAYGLPVSVPTIVLLNGIFELGVGLLLLAGIFTRLCALVLGLHLLGIAVSLGYNEIMVRDVGLGLATLSVALGGADEWCVDRKLWPQAPWWRA